MSFWLQCLATIQLTLAWIRHTANKIRVRVFIPRMIRTGYDMVRSPLGFWSPLQTHNRLNGEVIYDAVDHRVSASVAPTSWERWRWIGAIGTSGADYGDFFADLRVERGVASAAMTPAMALQLAYHQTGLLPGAMLRVTTRMGEEIVVSAETGEPAPAAASSSTEAGESTRYPELNYIR